MTGPVGSAPRRGDVWSTDAGVPVLVVSSTVYNEIPSEPTVVIVPIFDSEPDAGFGVEVGEGWAAPGMISSLRKLRLSALLRHVDVQTLTEVNTMVFRILATPER
ncbi:MAG TPA: type II toxin-antitoxin system PemK/MazF family toxin [Actinomycetospora sp.]|uniref:type II toxin-antitoxin system PemK/MazF family toxin n=1 Tax=Actinomycetospora sp. TaxID=1872135 RepID=UPI002F4046C1